jgi:hypothetical protein
MNDELERISTEVGRGLIWGTIPALVCSDRKTKKNFSQGSQWPGRDSKRAPPEYNYKSLLVMQPASVPPFYS